MKTESIGATTAAHAPQAESATRNYRLPDVHKLKETEGEFHRLEDGENIPEGVRKLNPRFAPKVTGAWPVGPEVPAGHFATRVTYNGQPRILEGGNAGEGKRYGPGWFGPACCGKWTQLGNIPDLPECVLSEHVSQFDLGPLHYRRLGPNEAAVIVDRAGGLHVEHGNSTGARLAMIDPVHPLTKAPINIFNANHAVQLVMSDGTVLPLSAELAQRVLDPTYLRQLTQNRINTNVRAAFVVVPPAWMAVVHDQNAADGKYRTLGPGQHEIYQEGVRLERLINCKVEELHVPVEAHTKELAKFDLEMFCLAQVTDPTRFAMTKYATVKDAVEEFVQAAVRAAVAYMNQDQLFQSASSGVLDEASAKLGGSVGGEAPAHAAVEPAEGLSLPEGMEAPTGKEGSKKIETGRIDQEIEKAAYKAVEESLRQIGIQVIERNFQLLKIEPHDAATKAKIADVTRDLVDARGKLRVADLKGTEATRKAKWNKEAAELNAQAAVAETLAQARASAEKIRLEGDAVGAATKAKLVGEAEGIAKLREELERVKDPFAQQQLKIKEINEGMQGATNREVYFTDEQNSHLGKLMGLFNETAGKNRR